MVSVLFIRRRPMVKELDNFINKFDEIGKFCQFRWMVIERSRKTEKILGIFYDRNELEDFVENLKGNYTIILQEIAGYLVNPVYRDT